MTAETEPTSSSDNIPTVITPSNDDNANDGNESVKSGAEGFDEEAELADLREEEELGLEAGGEADVKALQDELSKIKVEAPTMYVYY